MKERYSKDWIPLWIDKWLFGSTRLELEPAERSVWIDLIALGSKDNGFIRANEEIGYLPQQLAGLLNIPLELLQRTIEKCKKNGKLQDLGNNIYYISNWNKFQLSERQKRRFMSAKTDTMSAKTDIMSSKADIYSNININSNSNSNSNSKREENNIHMSRTKQSFGSGLHKIEFNFQTGIFENITEEDIKRWQEAYPIVNIPVEIKKIQEWVIANPKRKKKNWRRFIVNWLSKAQERGIPYNYEEQKTFSNPFTCSKCGTNHWTRRSECYYCGEKLDIPQNWQ
ncbi:MAG: phage replisome organizer N-terminal domain-containing protein [Candidatus Aenigmatarchaeota archaeon]